jgi:hypothetical protein
VNEVNEEEYDDDGHTVEKLVCQRLHRQS